MSRTNIDYLFQVTTPDRSFALPRGDADRPPFGDLLSHLSATTLPETTTATRRDEGRRASHEDDRSAESPAIETSKSPAPNDAVDAAGESESANAPQNETSNTTNEVGDKPIDSDDAVEDNEDVATLAEAAAVQSAQPNARVANENAVDHDVAKVDGATPEDAAAGAAEEGQPNNATRRTGARASIAGGAVRETIAATDETQFEDTTAASDESMSVKGSKRSRRAATHKTDNGANAESSHAKASGDADAVADAATREIQGEQAATELLADSEQDNKSPDTNDSRSERAGAGSRADQAAMATKIVAAAMNGAPTGDSGAKAAGDDAKSTVKPAAAKSDALTTAADRLHQPGISKRGAKADGDGDMPRVDAARFVGRVAKAFQTAHERGGTLQIRLNPPELGALRLELTVKDGVMTASLETDSNATRRVLLEHLPALRERLAEQNIRVERFDVDVRRDGGGQQHTAPQNQQHGHQNHSGSRRQPAMQARTEETPVRENTPVHPLSNNAGINLVA